MIEFGPSLIPVLYRVRQKWKTDFLENPEETVIREMSLYKERIRPGSRIGIAAGSRGIYHYSRIIKAVVDFVKESKAEPFIIPAMGSHGGATAEGQLEVLEGYGITPESMGVPFLSSMETNTIGYTKEGVPVHFDKNACSMDGIIMVNRIKPHTDFHGEIESGIMKQMAIGLGKQRGASTIHRRGIYGLSVLMPESARVILDKMPILMGVAILENQQDLTAKIEVLPAERIEARERELLKEAKALLPALPCDKLDVLVLQEMGKNISGTGIDPNIVGRYLIRNMPDQLPDIYRIVCLDLTEESQRNAIGVGIADLITRRMYEKINFEPTYVNTMTSGFLERGFMPVVAESDREAIETALNCCNRYVTAENARMVMAKNTLELQELIVSEALLLELEGKVEIMEKVQLNWDKQGYMKNLF
ncbi:protein of unknown function [Eubacterium maltosivorans]|uniref:lactate racemase domain-containing protein n=1 Tax=Eubacterium maltosivorans TaxID=2041044 RepID=UPI00088999D8|nr:lactate racemase domain-containing protein [Eubacterium maltosivorans]WPK80378.1 hypothetical protein EUMA32_17900 [Eubacterium maltosivorans]SDO91005.1 protein of unknown function [Eubacterium maltosivorans]